MITEATPREYDHLATAIARYLETGTSPADIATLIEPLLVGEKRYDPDRLRGLVIQDIERWSYNHGYRGGMVRVGSRVPQSIADLVEEVFMTFPKGTLGVAGLAGLGVYGRTYSYGQMPQWDEFEAAFDSTVPNGGRYTARLSQSDSRAAAGTTFGDGEFTARQLYRAVKELIQKWERGSGPAGDLAAGVLATLGIEWI